VSENWSGTLSKTEVFTLY